jgi:hypothetical protein
MEPTFDFGEALIALKQGLKVARTGWNGKGMHLGLQVPDEGSMNKRPYIYIIPVDGQRVPWVASQSDLLSEDWYEVDE